MAMDRDSQQLQRQRDQHNLEEGTIMHNGNCSPAVSPQLKPKQPSKSPRTVKHKVCKSVFTTSINLFLLYLFVCSVQRSYLQNGMYNDCYDVIIHYIIITAATCYNSILTCWWRYSLIYQWGIVLDQREVHLCVVCVCVRACVCVHHMASSSSGLRCPWLTWSKFQSFFPWPGGWARHVGSGGLG